MFCWSISHLMNYLFQLQLWLFIIIPHFSLCQCTALPFPFPDYPSSTCVSSACATWRVAASSTNTWRSATGSTPLLTRSTGRMMSLYLRWGTVQEDELKDGDNQRKTDEIMRGLCWTHKPQCSYSHILYQKHLSFFSPQDCTQCSNSSPSIHL